MAPAVPSTLSPRSDSVVPLGGGRAGPGGGGSLPQLVSGPCLGLGERTSQKAQGHLLVCGDTLQQGRVASEGASLTGWVTLGRFLKAFSSGR